MLQSAGITPKAPLTFRLTGEAGQSFGAFAVPGMELVLRGLANDFVGKSLSGGEIILRGQGRAGLFSPSCTRFSATSPCTGQPAEH